uniref:Uncharacterized protein MANES_01G254000 n=1 Tax=Rhizophora mucronata TaxID=61149 RepID=A0A2P2ISB9_RHIMU
MAGFKFSMLRSLSNSIRPCWKQKSFQSRASYTKLTRPFDRSKVRSPYGYANDNFRGQELKPAGNFLNAHLKILSSDDSTGYTYRAKTIPITAFSPALSNLSFQRVVPLVSVTPVLLHQWYSSSSASKADKSGPSEVSVTSGGSDGGVVGSDWVDKVKDAWQSSVDAVTYTGEKAKAASEELTPYVQQFLDSHPYLKDVVVPVSYTLASTILAWVVMPRILRRLHKYAVQTPAALLSGGTSEEQVAYEKSLWGALEDPLRYLITFMAFAQIAMMVAPTTIASQYMAQTWRGAVIISFVWFLHRWKTNVFRRLLASQTLAGVDREKIITLDRVFSVGLFVIGVMALAEACGVAVQSILTVGGIGGVATAFAAREILGNVLSGLSMQFSKPFSLGDTIKAGSVEGQVVQMGLTSTSLLNAEKFPVVVPNSLFSSQVIVNKSRAQCRTMVTKIPLKLDNLGKVPQISNDIKSMLKLYPKVYLEREAPYCFLSRVESSFAELTLGCNLKYMSKDEFYDTEQDILLQSAQIIKKNGAALGRTWEDTASQ